MGEWTDGALANAVVLSQVDAYTELWHRHVASVTAVTTMILGKRSDCEDVVADVFVGFWLAPEEYDARRGTVLAHLRQMARVRSFDLVRSDTVHRRRVTSHLPVRPREPDLATIGAEAAGELRMALAHLPPDERAPIELAFYLGMTYEAVAHHLLVPESTVKSRIRKGLHRLEVNDQLEQRLEDRSGPGADREANVPAGDVPAGVEP